MILIVENEKTQEVLAQIKKCHGCEDAVIIGNVTSDDVASVLMETGIGGKRIIQPLEGVMIPRIC